MAPYNVRIVPIHSQDVTNPMAPYNAPIVPIHSQNVANAMAPNNAPIVPIQAPVYLSIGMLSRRSKSNFALAAIGNFIRRKMLLQIVACTRYGSRHTTHQSVSYNTREVISGREKIWSVFHDNLSRVGARCGLELKYRKSNFLRISGERVCARVRGERNR